MPAARIIRHAIASTAAVAASLAISLPATAQEAGDARLESLRSEVDARFAIGRSAARALGYRIAWQSTVDAAVTRYEVIGDDVYVLDAANRLSRIDRGSGTIVWTITAADANDKVWGITPGLPGRDGLPWGRNADDKLYVTTDSVVFVYDHATGAILGRQDLRKVPSTDVVRSGSYLLFGTRGGQVIWHQYVVGQEWRANQLLGPVTATPTLVGGDNLAVASRGGTVLLLDIKTAGRLWGDKVFDGVTAPLTAGGGFVFVAGEDQYLWAFDARNGRTAWRYFTESPLREAPIYVDASVGGGAGGAVLQWSESDGLVCLDADPGDTIEGSELWKLPDARGVGLGVIGDRVALWDAENHVVRLIDVRNGSVARSIELPNVDELRMVGDAIYASDRDGRVLRLDPVG